MPIFCRLVQKGAVFITLVISGDTGQILIMFAHDAATILPLNIFQSELPMLIILQRQPAK